MTNCIVACTDCLRTAQLGAKFAHAEGCRWYVPESPDLSTGDTDDG